MRTTLSWLHISDIHFDPQTEWRDNVSRDSLIDYLKSLFGDDSSLRPDLIFCTGDIAYGEKSASPLSKQYEQAEDFFDKLLAVCGNGSSPLSKERLFVVPGNHDVNRMSVNPDAQDTLSRWAKEADRHISEINSRFNDRPRVFKESIKRLDEYAQFVQSYLPHQHDADERHRYSRIIDIEGLKVGVAGFNSAWSCAGAEDDRAVWMAAEWQFNAAKRELKDAFLRIGLIHHPVDWLNIADRNIAKQRISTDFHFWLNGHVHDAWVDPSQSNITISAGAVGAETNEEFGVNIVRINLAILHGTVYLHHRKAGGTSWTIAPVEVHAPKAEWPLRNLPPSLRMTAPATTSEEHSLSSPIVERGAKYDPSKYVFFVPFRQKGDQVIGRAEALLNVHDQLTKGRRTSIGQTALFKGLGGLGKTQLAVEYAYQYKNEYPNGVIWINADQDIDAQLTELAERAGWIAPESEHKFKLEIAKQRVRSYSDCLIIFDNLVHIDDVKGYLPEPSAQPHILITSRIEQPGFIPVHLELLDEELSLALLTQEAGRKPEEPFEMEAARNIARKLGGLPLALELAGAYLRHRTNVGWSQYYEILETNIKAALPKRFLEGSFTKHEADIYSTLKVNEEVFAEEPLLKKILDLLTWSGPASMGLQIMCSLLDERDTSLLINALGLGTSLRLLQKTPGEERYSLHRLVSEVRREEIPLGKHTEWCDSVCKLIGDWFEGRREEFVDLPLFEAEIDHLTAWQDNSQKFAPEHTSRLMWLHSYPPYHRGDYKTVNDFIEKAFEWFEKKVSADDALKAHLLNDIGVTQAALGNYLHQLEYYEEALEIRMNLFGERHRDTAMSLNNVGGAYGQKGNHARALEYLNRALKSRMGLFGESHHDTAWSISDIGCVYGLKGEYDRELEYGERALRIRIELFGECHPHTATTLNNIGLAYGHKGNYDMELEHFEKALRIRIELFGYRHPDTAAALNNMGMAYGHKGNYDRALEYHEKALKIYIELFGDRHPDAATSLSNTGSIYDKKGDYDRALEYYEQALKIQMEIFGESHPSIASSLNNIGGAYREKGNYDRALEYYERALKIQMEIFGESHPAIASSLSNVGAMYYKKGNKPLAAEKSGNALRVYRTLLGDSHSESLSCALNHLGVLFDLKRYHTAIPILNDFLRVIPPDHPSYKEFLYFQRQPTPGFRKQPKRSKKKKPR